MKRLCWAQVRLTMKDRNISTKIDPATGRPLPTGVEYRGKGQYRARKRIAGGKRIHQTFSTARPARRWLDTTSAKLELGQFEDTRPLERQTVHELVDRYVREEMLTRDNDRKGHIPAILQDEIAHLPLVDLSGASGTGRLRNTAPQQLSNGSTCSLRSASMRSRSGTCPSRKTRQQLRQSDVQQVQTKNETDVSSVMNTTACWKSWQHPP